MNIVENIAPHLTSSLLVVAIATGSLALCAFRAAKKWPHRAQIIRLFWGAAVLLALLGTGIYFERFGQVANMTAEFYLAVIGTLIGMSIYNSRYRD